jgi:hypothetical protein
MRDILPSCSTDLLVVRSSVGATDRPHFTHQMMAGMLIVVFRDKFTLEKSPFFFTFSAPCGQARSYSKESNNRIIFFFFAKTIKTVVAGSFVP